MATFQQRKNKDGSTSWRVLVRLKGHPVQTATFARKSDAGRWAKQVEAAILEGRHFQLREAKKRTLRELLERYVVDVLPARPKRYRLEVERQLRWWIGALGDYRLVDVTPALVAEARDRLLRGESRSGRKVSAATCNRHLAALSHAFSIAEKEWGWVEHNPCRKVRRPREPRGRVRFLADDERERLLAACRESPEPRLLPLVVLALATGARQGELLKLRWQDVDLERGVAVLEQTKNGERRALPLSPTVVDVLAAYAADAEREASAFFFANARGVVRFPRRPWENALREAGLEDFRFHDLRHSAASYLAMNGATLAEIAEVLGHKTLAMVKRYSHLTELHTRRVVTRMNEKIFNGASTQS